MCMVIYSSTCNIFLIQILFSLIFLNKFLKICFIILLYMYTGSMLLKKYLYETHYVISYMHAGTQLWVVWTGLWNDRIGLLLWHCPSLTTIKTKLINGIANLLSGLTILTNILNNKFRHFIVFISISESHDHHFSWKECEICEKNWLEVLICCHENW